MSRVRVGRWAKAEFVASIDRELLERFFRVFEAEIDRQVELGMLLADYLEDAEYQDMVAWLLKSAKHLPEGLLEALLAVEEMASRDGEERFEKMFAKAGTRPQFKRRSSLGDVAIQVWLDARDLFEEAHDQVQLKRLAAWQHYYAESGNAGELAVPEAAALREIEADLDVWFAEHNRGSKTSRVQPMIMDGELYFLVRHGDTFARKAAVDGQRVELLHYRPRKDDVVVYCPERHELRVNAHTKGEKELYRRVFGDRLFGRADYFAAVDAYTLNPLAEHGKDALEVSDVEGIKLITLKEVQVNRGEHTEEVVTHKAWDLFWTREGLPKDGEITRAVFAVHFFGFKSGRVEVRPPAVLKLGKECDPALIHRWMEKRGFRKRGEMRGEK